MVTGTSVTSPSALPMCHGPSSSDTKQFAGWWCSTDCSRAPYEIRNTRTTSFSYTTE